MKYKKDVAVQYAKRAFGNTDEIAFQCVAELPYLREKKILDLGTGSGRSSRFLQQLGNEVVGLDISAEMIEKAREDDPQGTYILMEEGRTFPFDDHSFDIVFTSWMILELNSKKIIKEVFSECCRVARTGGYFLNVTNTPGFYQYSWLSIDNSHPENKLPLKSGQRVKATLLPEGVVVHDYFWSHQDYLECLEKAGFKHLNTLYPKAKEHDTIQWKDEINYAPYAIYIAQPK